MQFGQGGYADDFDRFLRQGAIGNVVSLQVLPEQPEIGADVEVRVFGLPSGRLTLHGGGQWRVEDGGSVWLRADRRLQLTLCDEEGHAHAWATVDPWVMRPLLQAWNLPDRVDYSLESLPLPIEARQCDSVSLLWRFAEDPEWQLLPAGAALPLPRQPAELVIRAVLSSRHAGLSPDATVVVDRPLTLHHPEPEVRGGALPAPVRYEDARVSWQVRWARSACLKVNGHPVPVELGDAPVWSVIDSVIPTANCGSVRLELSITGLDGEVRAQVGHIEVRPRDVRIEVRPIDTGQVELEVLGARALSLAVPARDQRIELPTSNVVVTHGLLLPTLAIVTFEDDLGHIGARSFTLGNEPFAWSPVPTFRPLEWRWT